MDNNSRNEYLQEFNKLRDTNSYKAEQWLGKRGKLVDKYSFAVPSFAAVNYIRKLEPIVEIGAGNGYWSYVIGEDGTDITAYDISPEVDQWTEVTKGDEKYISFHPSDSTLLLCWPPYDNPMAINCLRKHQQNGGEDVIYVGEIGGCTADDEFHRELLNRYALIKEIEIPSYQGIRDNMYHFHKKI